MVSTATMRRIALFLAILMSGGQLYIPRIPLFVGLVALYCWLPTPRRRLDRSIVLPVVLVAFVMFVEALRPNGADFIQSVTRLTNFAGGILLLNLYRHHGRGALESDLFAILQLFCIQAIATTVLGSAVPALFMPGPENESFTVLFLLNFHEAGAGLVRPDGFFWEPGVLQCYLNIFLYLCLFVFHRPRSAVLAVAAIFATRSTTGLVIMMVLLAFYFVGMLGRVRFFTKVVTFVAGAIIAIPLGLLVYTNVVEKVSGDLYGSFDARQFDLLTGLAIVAQHPVAGIGFSNEVYAANAVVFGFRDTLVDNSRYDDRGTTTNGLVYAMYTVGIPLAAVFLLGMFRQDLLRRGMLFGFVLAVTFLSEAMIFTPFFLMFIFAGFRLRVAAPVTAGQRRAAATSGGIG